jgi:hypothetical protein
MIKTVLALAVLFFAVTPAWATFTLVQSKSLNTTTCDPTCPITVASTGSGNTGVIGIAASSNVTFVSATGATWTACGTNCRTGNATSGWTDMAYTTSLTGGSTTITITLSNNPPTVTVYFWELSSTASISFDHSASVLDTTNCTSCAGTGITIGGLNDAILTIAACGGTCSAVTTYTATPPTFTAGDGAGHLLNTTSGAAPTWTQSPTSNLAAAAIALKDASSVGNKGKAAIW